MPCLNTSQKLPKIICDYKVIHGNKKFFTANIQYVCDYYYYKWGEPEPREPRYLKDIKTENMTIEYNYHKTLLMLWSTQIVFHIIYMYQTDSLNIVCMGWLAMWFMYMKNVSIEERLRRQTNSIVRWDRHRRSTSNMHRLARCREYRYTCCVICL